MHEISRYSNYFPVEKVVNFFENIILSNNKVKDLTEYATKKYSEMVARAHEMKGHRREIIRSFLNKMNTHDIFQVVKVLKGIFSSISIGEIGKRDFR